MKRKSSQKIKKNKIESRIKKKFGGRVHSLLSLLEAV